MPVTTSTKAWALFFPTAAINSLPTEPSASLSSPEGVDDVDGVDDPNWSPILPKAPRSPVASLAASLANSAAFLPKAIILPNDKLCMSFTKPPELIFGVPTPNKFDAFPNQPFAGLAGL